MSPTARANILASAKTIDRHRIRLAITKVSHNQVGGTETNKYDGDNSASVTINLVVTANSNKCIFHIVATCEYESESNSKPVLLSWINDGKCGEQVSCVTNRSRLFQAVEGNVCIKLVISLQDMTITLTGGESLVGNVTLVTCR